MKTLTMIRHSLTEGNERRLYYGKTDLPLSGSGRELCVSLRGSFDLPENIRFATSGMLRAEETLELIFGKVEHIQLHGLREMEMGVFEMKSYDQLKDTEAFQNWLSDASGSYHIPDGESNLEFFQRTLSCVKSLLESETEHLFVACHGGVIASIMFQFFPKEMKSFYDWIPHACQGYAITFDGKRAVEWKKI